VDIPLWKVNLNTVQYALVSLAACTAFSRYLRLEQKRYLWLTYALCALNFFTKELAANTVFLLLLVWGYRDLQREELHPRKLGGAVLRAARLLWVPVLLTLLYVAAHRLLIRNIYTAQQIDYRFVDPVRAVWQSLFIYNHALLPFYADPVLLPKLPELHAALRWAVQYVVVSPLVLGALAWFRRDRVLLFGLGWIFLSFVPSVFMEIFLSSRFFYLPAVGAALVLARLIEYAWTWLGGRSPGPSKWGRFAFALFLAYFVAVNLALTDQMVQADLQASERVRSLYALLAAHRGQVPPGSLVVLRNAPESFFLNGLGAREMTKMALADSTAEGAIENQNLTPDRLKQLNAIPHVFVVDMDQETLQLVRDPTQRSPR